MYDGFGSASRRPRNRTSMSHDRPRSTHGSRPSGDPTHLLPSPPPRSAAQTLVPRQEGSADPRRIRKTPQPRPFSRLIARITSGWATARRPISERGFRLPTSSALRRDLQQLSRAHLGSNDGPQPRPDRLSPAEFIRELHRRFCAQIPESMRVATTSRGVPDRAERLQEIESCHSRIPERGKILLVASLPLCH